MRERKIHEYNTKTVEKIEKDAKKIKTFFCYGIYSQYDIKITVLICMYHKAYEAIKHTQYTWYKFLQL